MKSLEILQALPKWAKARPEQVFDSPAFAMPCRLGDASATLRREVFETTDTLDLAVLFGDEPHTLRLARAARFAFVTPWKAILSVPISPTMSSCPPTVTGRDASVSSFTLVRFSVRSGVTERCAPDISGAYWSMRDRT